MPAAEGTDFRKADVTFDRNYDLDLGGVSSNSRPSARPTRRATPWCVPSERVLYSGDVAMRAPAFASPQSSHRQW